MTTEINRFVEQNKNLVHFVIRKWFKLRTEDEDFFQEGLIGLWEAAKSYDKTKGQFSTYAVAIIRNKLSSALRKENCIKRREGNVLFISFNDDNNIEDEIADNESIEERICVREIWKDLEEQDRTILRQRITLKTVEDIAESLHLSKRTTQRKLKKAKENFIEKYNKEVM